MYILKMKIQAYITHQESKKANTHAHGRNYIAFQKCNFWLCCQYRESRIPAPVPCKQKRVEQGGCKPSFL